jgi:hypothetical protein
VATKYANNGIFVLPQSANTFFNDPISGVSKNLFIAFTMQGQKYSIMLGEQTATNIPIDLYVATIPAPAPAPNPPPAPNPAPNPTPAQDATTKALSIKELRTLLIKHNKQAFIINNVQGEALNDGSSKLLNKDRYQAHADQGFFTLPYIDQELTTPVDYSLEGISTPYNKILINFTMNGQNYQMTFDKDIFHSTVQWNAKQAATFLSTCNALIVRLN